MSFDFWFLKTVLVFFLRNILIVNKISKKEKKVRRHFSWKRGGGRQDGKAIRNVGINEGKGEAKKKVCWGVGWRGNGWGWSLHERNTHWEWDKTNSVIRLPYYYTLFCWGCSLGWMCTGNNMEHYFSSLLLLSLPHKKIPTTTSHMSLPYSIIFFLPHTSFQHHQSPEINNMIFIYDETDTFNQDVCDREKEIKEAQH